MKKPLNSWRLPTTSSNSPVSLFLMDERLFLACFFERAAQTCNYIDWEREHDGSIFFRADLYQSLQISELHPHPLFLDPLRRHAQLLCRGVFAFGMDNFGAPLALGFGFSRQRAGHLLPPA